MAISKKTLIFSSFTLGLFFLTAGLVYAAPVPTTKCKIYRYNDIIVAKHCYTMTGEWRLSDYKVRCVGDGSAKYVINEPGYSWSNKYNACNPKSYSNEAHGISTAKLKKNGNPWKNSSIRCDAYGTLPAYISCY